MSDTEKQVDFLAEMLLGSLCDLVPSPSAGRRSMKPFAWRSKVMLAAARKALPELRKNKDFAELLTRCA